MTTRWATAAQLALVTSLNSSQNEIQNLEIIDDANILNRTKDAVITLQNVLHGKHDSEIEDTLNQYQVPPDRWWSSLYKVVEGKYCFSSVLLYFQQYQILNIFLGSSVVLGINLCSISNTLL